MVIKARLMEERQAARASALELQRAQDKLIRVHQVEGEQVRRVEQESLSFKAALSDFQEVRTAYWGEEWRMNAWGVRESA